MPIRAEFRHLYGRVWREVTRPRILSRAGHCCEQCGKPNGSDVTVVSLPVSDRPTQFWLAAPSWWVRCSDGETFLNSALARAFSAAWKPRALRVVLTIAHLNHIAGDDRDENLKALCQWCHLNYDKVHHQETRATRKDAARPLLHQTA